MKKEVIMAGKRAIWQILLLICGLIKSQLLFAQEYPIVQSHTGGSLTNPWAGGLNNCQFHHFDLNHDSIRDLIVFDRHGNKLLAFVNTGKNSERAFEFSPELSNAFPPLYNWLQVADYNADGKNDLFTYGYASIQVYKNTSTTSGLSFQLVTEALTSMQGGKPFNLYVTDVDYPAISDMDNDGDLDMITFFGLGSYMDYHKNLSIEATGTADTLLYTLEKRGWGDIKEGEETNELFLDMAFTGKTKHSGSTFFIDDLNEDGYKDILLGDIGYTSMMALINSGAKIKRIDSTLFNDAALPLFPVCSSIDINNDDTNELIVSSFDPSLLSQGDLINAFTLHRDSVTPKCILHSSAFLQSEMIDRGIGAYPLLFDWNSDGLTDLFISNHYNNNKTGGLSSVYLYLNTGSKNNPVFTLIDTNFGDLLQLNRRSLYPAFADLDQDGDADMILGHSGGSIDLYLNQNNQLALSRSNLNAINTGEYSTPALADISGDSKPDLVIGNKDGGVSYYENTSTGNVIEFSKRSSVLDNINVTDENTSWYGYSTPSFVNKNDSLLLLIGSENGHTFVYHMLYSAGAINATLISDNWLPVAGIRNGVTAADINNDQLPEYISGNYSGGCRFFEGTTVTSIEQSTFLNESFSLIPNPCKAYVELFFNATPSKIYNLAIYDIAGSTILSMQIQTSTSNKITVHTESLNSGIYLLTIKNLQTGFTQTKKLVKGN